MDVKQPYSHTAVEDKPLGNEKHLSAPRWTIYIITTAVFKLTILLDNQIQFIKLSVRTHKYLITEPTILGMIAFPLRFADHYLQQ